MIKITVSNYIFPIHFKHNGWNVTLNKKFSFNTLSVEAVFEPEDVRKDVKSEQEWLKIHLYPSQNTFGGFGSLGRVQISIDDYNKYLDVSNRFLTTHTHCPSIQKQKFSANNLLDNFVGSNTSATKKVIEKVEAYMSSRLPANPVDKKSYVSYLKTQGVSINILAIIDK